MELEGSFDNWQSRQRMQRSGKDFTLVKLLPPGVYQVSFPTLPIYCGFHSTFYSYAQTLILYLIHKTASNASNHESLSNRSVQSNDLSKLKSS